MIGCGLDTGSPQIGINLFNVLAGSCINDAERRPAGQFHNGPNFFMVGCDFPYFKAKVWAMESTYDLSRLCNFALLQNVATGRRCGGGVKSRHRRALHRLDLAMTK